MFVTNYLWMQLAGYLNIFGLYLLIIDFFYYQCLRISVYVYLVLDFLCYYQLYGELIDFVEQFLYVYPG